jgi:hypothetical protein
VRRLATPRAVRNNPEQSALIDMAKKDKKKLRKVPDVAGGF